MIRTKHDAGWAEMVQGWKQAQLEMRRRMVVTPLRPLPRFVAGADGAFSSDKQTVYAAAVVYDREIRQIVEVAHATVPAEIPYVPGFLSFREGPALRLAIAKLKHPFGVICFDAHG